MELKNIYRGNEIKFANLFRATAAQLLTEFNNEHPNFQTGADFASVPYYQNPTGANSALYSDHNAWKVSGIKHSAMGLVNNNRVKYPTAFELVEAFGEHCQMAAYSIVDANSIIYRHTGVENRDAKFIRIHVPLYVPQGDIGFEVEGEVVFWDDVWGFNNQKLHSVWNNTPERRLVLLIDLSREICNLPPAPPWTPGCNENIPEFEKTRDPSQT